MRLLFVTEFFPGPKQIFTGGVEARIFYTIRSLRRKYKVDVISRPPTQVPVSLASIVSRLLFIFIAIFKGSKLQPDIVEGSNVTCYFPAWLIAKIKHAKAVAWIPDILGENWRYFGLVGIIGRFWEWSCLKLPWDHYLALSQQTRNKLLDLGIKPDKITVIYPGVNHSEFNLSVSQRRLPTLCVIARLVPYKHVDQAIVLIHQLKSSLVDIRLLIIGAGPQLSQLKSLARKLKVTNQIYFKSDLPRAELIKQLKSCHLLCHFSTVEGFGLVILEALAAGLPYVAYDTPINHEVTHSGQGGILVPTGDTTAATQAVTSLFQNHRLYRRKLLEGNQLLTHYSWPKSAATTERVFRSLLEK